jgi:hypothetical protein
MAVRDAGPSTASGPRGRAVPRNSTAGRWVDASLLSVRGPIMAAFGAITSLGCIAAIGLVSIAGPTGPTSPGTSQPLPIVQPRGDIARR